MGYDNVVFIWMALWKNRVVAVPSLSYFSYYGRHDYSIGNEYYRERKGLR